MTIEEAIIKDSAKFEEILDSKAPVMKAAMNDLSAKLDEIFREVIKEYCAQTGAEADLNAIPTYKNMNKIITSKLDVLIGDHIKEKRQDL